MRLTDPDVDPTRERRRTSFDEKALQYDAIRPPYPEAVFDDLFHRTNARRVVEIGAGTGRATLPLARLGMDVVAIEPGPRLAAILRRKVAPFPSVTVEETTFEAWAGQGCPYDLVLAAQAIHWIDSAVRYAKPARIARHLVLLTNEIDRIDAQVREEFDRAYERWTGTGEGNERARHAVDHAIRKWTAEIDGSGLYGPVHVGAFPWETTYDAEEFVSLVDTWSDHATMEQPCRRGLYEALSQAIEHHGGRLRVPYVALAFVAESRA